MLDVAYEHKVCQRRTCLRVDLVSKCARCMSSKTVSSLRRRCDYPADTSKLLNSRERVERWLSNILSTTSNVLLNIPGSLSSILRDVFPVLLCIILQIEPVLLRLLLFSILCVILDLCRRLRGLELHVIVVGVVDRQVLVEFNVIVVSVGIFSFLDDSEDELDDEVEYMSGAVDMLVLESEMDALSLRKECLERGTHDIVHGSVVDGNGLKVVSNQA